MIEKDLGIATAYGYATSKGYTGTEEQFAELMASYASVAQQAAGSASAAAGSAAAAQTYSQTAIDKAIEASQSAQAAASSATGASGSAQTATEKAAQASEAADTAEEAANAATTKASEAATSASTAETAKADAVSAKNDAISAKDAALTAKTDAEAAKDAAEAAARQAEDTLDSYAHVDGYYDEMAVGSAEQLISTVLTEDSVPYNFRTSGGSADIGNRETDMVVGGTISWDQLYGNPETWTTIASASEISISGKIATITGHGTLTAYNPALTSTKKIQGIIGHVYMMSVDVSFPVATRPFVRSLATGDFVPAEIPANTLTRISTVKKAIQDGEVMNYIGVFQASTVLADGDSIQVGNPQCFDLTQMFGPTIADYIYGLETAEAGAGVAWFRKLFPKDYYEHNPGELMSVKASAHEMVGFNQWDEEWFAGHINSSGEQVSDGTYRLISKNFIPVIPNLQYCFTLTSMTDCGITIYGYDENKKFIGVVYDGNAYSNTRLFTPGDGVHYIKFQMYATYGQTASLTYNQDICINLSWSGYRNGEYEPFQKHTYALDSSLELRGIPKLSADNELYYDGDTYESDGMVTRRYGIVDLGTLNWAYNASLNGAGAFYVLFKDAKKPTSDFNVANAVSSGLSIAPASSVYLNITQSGRASINSYGYIQVRFLSLTDASAFKAAMSGVMLVYELETPTTETAEPYTNPQIVDDFGTEEYVDYAYEQGLRDVKIPVGHVTEYQANLRDKLQHLPDLADSDGYYLIQQAGNQMALARFRIPQAPSTDGTYTLKATVSGGTPTYVWVDDNATTEEDNT